MLRALAFCARACVKFKSSGTVHHTQIVSLAIIKMFSLFNTRAKANHIRRPAPLSMNELTTTEYWNSYAIWNL